MCTFGSLNLYAASKTVFGENNPYNANINSSLVTSIFAFGGYTGAWTINMLYAILEKYKTVYEKPDLSRQNEKDNRKLFEHMEKLLNYYKDAKKNPLPVETIQRFTMFRAKDIKRHDYEQINTAEYTP